MRQLKLKVGCLVFLAMGCTWALAEDNLPQIRPTVFLNVDTAETLESGQFVVTAYGIQGARLSWGAVHNLEVRADLSLASMISNPLGSNGVSYGNGIAAKYQLLDFFLIRIAPRFQFYSSAVAGSVSSTTFLGGIAMDGNYGPVSIGFVPRWSSTAGIGASGLDLAGSVAIVPFLDAIAELNWTSTTGQSVLGGSVGLAIKPDPRVTLQTILASNAGSNVLGVVLPNAPTNLGLIALFGNIGFQF
jgi:hypothetical protein